MLRFQFPIVIIDEDYRSENASGLGIRALAAAISPPERGRAGAYDRPGHHLRGQGEAEVRRDRGGGQAEGHHQKVEGAGAELGGDGDSRRDPPPGCR